MAGGGWIVGRRGRIVAGRLGEAMENMLENWKRWKIWRKVFEI